MKPLLLIIFTFLIFVSSAQISVPIPSINKVKVELIKFIEDEKLKNASIGFYAIELETGKVIAEYNPDMSLIPASILKLVTTATALEVLGENFRFKTTIQYNGEIDSTGTLNGNIFIKGGGDPTLGSKLFEKNYFEPFFMDTWADSIVSFGIDSINGAIIGDASIFNKNMIPGTWIWGDIGNYYGASANGLSIYENTYKIKFKSGTSHGDTTEIVDIEPTIPNIEFDNHVWSSNINKDNAYIYGAPFNNYRYIEGSIPRNRDEFIVKGSIPDPPYLTSLDFNSVLERREIGIGLPATTLRKLSIVKDTISRKDICITYSPRLKNIIYWTNLKSNNLFAEHMLNYLGYLKYSTGDNKSGTEAVEEFWKSKGINTSGMYINDGSGLSRYNVITTKQIVDILQYMKLKSKNYDVLNKSFPIAGKTGTLRSMCKGTPGQGKIRAKSGTMTRVKSYAGYVTAVNDKELAFAIIVNNYNGSSVALRKKIEKIFDALAMY